jgi:hypothetical protein
MDYDEQEREFAPLVGKAILNFGLIEFSILEAAGLLPNEVILETAAKLQFKPRIELLIEILSGKRNKGDALARLIRLLKEALKRENCQFIFKFKISFSRIDHFTWPFRRGLWEKSSSATTTVI